MLAYVDNPAALRLEITRFAHDAQVIVQRGARTSADVQMSRSCLPGTDRRTEVEHALMLASSSVRHLPGTLNRRRPPTMFPWISARPLEEFSICRVRPGHPPLDKGHGPTSSNFRGIRIFIAAQRGNPSRWCRRRKGGIVDLDHEFLNSDVLIMVLIVLAQSTIKNLHISTS